MDASPTPTVAWNDDFAGVDTQPRLQPFDMESYHFDHQWEMIGDYNWKTLADNYNEVSYLKPSHLTAAEITLSVLPLSNRTSRT